MKYTLSLFSLLYSLLSLAQVPYTEIEGRLVVHLPEDTSSIHIGKNAGLKQDLFQRKNNTYVGNGAGRENVTGSSNNFFGVSAGQNTNSSFNSFFGSSAGIFNEIGLANSYFGHGAGYFMNGSHNVVIGNFAAWRTSGSGNVIIGNRAGPHAPNENTTMPLDNRLYIDNIYTPDPLIYGEFDNDFLRINGDHEIVGEAKVILPGIAAERTSTLILESITSQRPSIQFAEDSDEVGMNIEYDGSSGDDEIRINGYPNNTIATFEESGNVGIGTDDPEMKLTIGGAENESRLLLSNGGDIFFKNAAGDNKAVLTLHTDNDTYLDAFDDLKLRSGHNLSQSNPEMIIKANGNVGIGTAEPTATLHVDDLMKLEPRTSAPTCNTSNDEGRIYYDSSLQKFRGCVSSGSGPVIYGWADFH